MQRESTPSYLLANCETVASFSIVRKVNYGEAIFLAGSCPELGNNHRRNALRLDCQVINIDTHSWKADQPLSIPAGHTGLVTYHYFIASSSYDDPEHVICDDIERTFAVEAMRGNSTTFSDEWGQLSGPDRVERQPISAMVYFRITFPWQVEFGERLFLIPLEGELSQIDTKRQIEIAIPMFWTPGNLWKARFGVPLGALRATGGQMTLAIVKSGYFERNEHFWSEVSMTQAGQSAKRLDVEQWQWHEDFKMMVPTQVSLGVSSTINKISFPPESNKNLAWVDFTVTDRRVDGSAILYAMTPFGAVRLHHAASGKYSGRIAVPADVSGKGTDQEMIYTVFEDALPTSPAGGVGSSLPNWNGFLQDTRSSYKNSYNSSSSGQGGSGSGQGHGGSGRNSWGGWGGYVSGGGGWGGGGVRGSGGGSGGGGGGGGHWSGGGGWGGWGGYGGGSGHQGGSSSGGYGTYSVSIGSRGGSQTSCVGGLSTASPSHKRGGVSGGSRNTGPPGSIRSSTANTLSSLANGQMSFGAGPSSSTGGRPGAQVVAAAQSISTYSNNMSQAKSQLISSLTELSSIPDDGRVASLRAELGFDAIKERLRVVAATKPSVTEIKLVMETLAGLCAKVAEARPVIKEQLDKLKQANRQLVMAQDTYSQQSLSTVRLKLFRLAKQWGRLIARQASTDDFKPVVAEAIGLLQGVFPDDFAGDSGRDLVFSLMAINDMSKKNICPKLDHGSSCQVSMQSKYATHFQRWGTSSVPPHTIGLFTPLSSLVFDSTQEYFTLASSYGFSATYSDYENNLMRALMAYFLSYISAQHVQQDFPQFNPGGCSEFKPYCEDKKLGSHALCLTTEVLEKVEAEFERRSGKALREVTTVVSAVETIEDAVVASTQDALGQEALAVLQVTVELNRVSELMAAGQPIEIDIVISAFTRLDNAAAKIDTDMASQSLISRVRNLSTHQDLNAVVSLIV